MNPAMIRLPSFALALVAAATLFAQEPPPRTLALLVGIAEYPPMANGVAMGPLQGPERDVARAEKLLRERFGFDPKGIAKLVGKDATHRAIVETFHAHLIRRAGPETRVVFWFSGHGSRILDASGRDAAPRDAGEDPFDQTLVAYDSRAIDPAGGYDLTDDELHSLLQALPSTDVVVVTDCCHAGGVLRGHREPGVRESDHGTVPLDWARVAPFWPSAVKLVDDRLESDLPAVVQVAACSALDEAGEISTPMGTHGTLTWFLTQVLREVDAKASWREVGCLVRARVAGRGTRRAQTPMVIGNGDRPVFGGSGRPSRPGFQVDRLGGQSNKWIVQGGTLHGLGLGAQLQLFDLDDAILGMVTVVLVKATSSTAEWQGSGAQPETAVRAVPKTLGEQQRPIRVACESGVDAALLADIELASKVDDPAQADYLLVKRAESLQLVDATGKAVREMAADASGVRTGLLEEHYFRSLWQGIAEPGRFALRVRVEAATDAEVERLQIARALLQPTETADGFAGAVVGAPTLEDRDRSTGGLVQLRVQNLDDEPVHLAIVSVTELREVNVLCGTDENNVLGPGQEFTKSVWVGPSPGWHGEQPMVDRYVVVATDRYADFRPFESPAQLVRTRGAGEANLPPFLREALGGARTRGSELTKPAWGIAFCDLQILSPFGFCLHRARDDAEHGRWSDAMARLRALAVDASDAAQRERVADALAVLGTRAAAAGATDAAAQARQAALALRR